MTLTLLKAWTRLTQWEFWPFTVLYFPVNFYFAWLALKCKSPFFFTAANPSIDFGGMLGESKHEILKLIPSRYLPAYHLITPGALDDALSFAKQLGYPLIAKPDVGERGRLVEKIHTPDELKDYVAKCSVPFLLQEYIAWQVELGVFYVRLPNASEGKITSLVQKDFMRVTGDGTQTVRQLLEKHTRALIQLDFDHQRFISLLDRVPPKGEEVLVESIGNHCRGTIFLNRNSQIDEGLEKAFDRITSEINGFYFGRFDLRCQSLEDLRELKNFKILELNGAGAEPGHIYQPGSSIWDAYKSIFWHLDVLAQISRMNQRNGYSYWNFGRGMRKLKAIRQYNKLIRSIK